MGGDSEGAFLERFGGGVRGGADAGHLQVQALSTNASGWRYGVNPRLVASTSIVSLVFAIGAGLDGEGIGC